jgi:predicted DNA-binding protein YlxM (UPF0122 family)
MASISRTLEMVQMRKDGHTLEEIAQAYGISRQRVCQIIGKTFRGDFDKIKRVHLRKFFERTEMSIRKFVFLVFGDYEKKHYKKISGFLEGDDAFFSFSQITKMCEITGLSFEELAKVGDD